LATKEEQRLSNEDAWSMGSASVMGSAMEAREVKVEGEARLNMDQRSLLSLDMIC
jgi:hypothetical protein